MSENLNQQAELTPEMFKQFMQQFAKNENLSLSDETEERMRQRAIKHGIITERDSLPYYVIKSEKGNYYISCPLLADYIRKVCHFVIVSDQYSKDNRMFWYSGGVYSQINDSTLMGYIKTFISGIDKALLKMRDVREVLQDLKTDKQFVDGEIFNANEKIINFKNGLYHIDTGKLTEHSHKIYSTIQIPCDYNPEATECPNFNKYLADLCENDEAKMKFLKQYMAVAISNVYGDRFKKMLLLCGMGNSGKSKILELTQELIGAGNTAICNFKDLEEKFGMSAIYHKRLVGHGDMSFLTVDEISNIKTLTGGDSVRIEFKGGNIFNSRFHGVLWFCTNQLPRFGGDKGDHVYERFIIMNIEHSIPEEDRDPLIAEKMFSEREAIINQLLPELQTVIKNGYRYDIPYDAQRAVEDYKTENSPVRQFFDECCELRSSIEFEAERVQTQGGIYEIFQQWYAVNVGIRAKVSAQTFKKEIMNHLHYPTLESMTLRKAHGRYYTFKVKPEYVDEYGGD